ncbi:sensor domain-containing diguanylate cyclase/phosphohydrolase [Atribacter laminatus]|uniref:3'3'-cGAMP-specific phosphodiesterase 2 n=1 Tax=Atribacter laminatus TaxID=2847778 RepID=A0A7T1AJ27_ATRLM|nr:HD domain-containing phosphohydrolase [Atribacter laminatus]QPM66830.1 3'3'-cGAMP-specific phosphodiesterase 2 [Atribacter laminatus]
MDSLKAAWNKHKRILMITAIITFAVLILFIPYSTGIPERGILGTFLIFLFTMMWGLKGGIIGAVYSIINLGYYIANSPHQIDNSFLVLGTVLYLFIGIALGRLLDVVRGQKADVSNLLKSLEQKETNYHNLFDTIVDGLFVFDINDIYGQVHIIDVNTVACRLLGYEKEEILRLTCFDLIDKNYSKKMKYIFGKLFHADQELLFETVFITKQGQKIATECHCNSIRKNGKVYGNCVVRDITERKKVEEKIRYLTFHDSLTGIYNRAYFENELEKYDNLRYLPISVIMGDMNGLKLVNDAFGHDEGDRLLKIAANSLKESCRQADTVARYGGDEFVILLPNTTTQEAEGIIERISNKISQTQFGPIPPSIALGCETKTFIQQDIHLILKHAEDNMYQQKLMSEQSNRSAVISTLERTLIEVSEETELHALRLQTLCDQMCVKLDLSSSLRNELRLLAVLHDIGKVAIPQTILTKAEELTLDEWKLIKQHTEIGYRIAQSSPDLAIISEGILSHHERWDGTGYPRGLKGEDIPLSARILSIADAYDVMISGRAYKPKMSKEEAMEEIKKGAGTQFDPELAKVFIEIVSNET